MSETIPGPDDGVSYGFSKKDAGRIAESTRRVEDYYQLPPPRRARWPVAGGSSLIPVQTPGGGIAAGSIGSPASATVTLLKPIANAPGYTTTGSTTTTMYSTYTTAVGATKFCWAARRNGYLYLVVGDC